MIIDVRLNVDLVDVRISFISSITCCSRNHRSTKVYGRRQCVQQPNKLRNNSARVHKCSPSQLLRSGAVFPAVEAHLLIDVAPGDEVNVNFIIIS